jgi:superfamily I DNA/RNA helicase
VGTDPEPGPVAQAFLGYGQALADAGGLDFDGLVARVLRLLEVRPALLSRRRQRCEHLLVDETQDVDRSQLRLALLLAAPTNPSSSSATTTIVLQTITRQPYGDRCPVGPCSPRLPSRA